MSLFLLGATRALLPYQGSKWRFRKEIAQRIREAGFRGPPSRVELTDPGPWGTTMAELLHAESRAHVVQRLDEFSVVDPSELFDHLQRRPASTNRSRFAAEHLFLQRLAFSGKAVGCAADVWESPGFNASSAYGLEATDKFGKVSPMIPSLVRTLGKMKLSPASFSVQRATATPPSVRLERTVYYVDPPYPGSTPYPDGDMTEEEVIALARAAHGCGAFVLISGDHPIAIPGWKHEKIQGKKEDDESPFKGKQEEWLTSSPLAEGDDDGA